MQVWAKVGRRVVVCAPDIGVWVDYADDVAHMLAAQQRGCPRKHVLAKGGRGSQDVGEIPPALVQQRGRSFNRDKSQQHEVWVLTVSCRGRSLLWHGVAPYLHRGHKSRHGFCRLMIQALVLSKQHLGDGRAHQQQGIMHYYHLRYLSNAVDVVNARGACWCSLPGYQDRHSLWQFRGCSHDVQRICVQLAVWLFRNDHRVGLGASNGFISNGFIKAKWT
jgi:hypothetical protein